MKVKVEMVIETEDFSEPEFRKEIEALILDIDPTGKTQLECFRMCEISETDAHLLKAKF